MRNTSTPMAVSLILATMLLVPSCVSQKDSRARPPQTAERVCLLIPVPGVQTAKASLEPLRRLFPNAIEVDHFEEAAVACLKGKRVLIIPAVRDFPVTKWTALSEYLDKGGAALFIGRDPFEARVRLVDGHAETEEELYRAMMQTARSVQGISPVVAWRHENDWGDNRGAIKPDPEARLAWPAARVEIEAFREWDAAMTDFPGGSIQSNENSLAFQARGDAGTSRLAVICVEEDGSHWFHVLGVNEQWQPFVLHEARFSYFYGGSNRGRDGDHLSLSRTRKISVGLSMFLGAQRPGNHSFGLSEVRFATDPRTVEQAVSWPDIMLLSPPFRRYETSAAKGVAVQLPIIRSRGMGGDRAAPFRHISLSQGNGRADFFVQPTDNGLVKLWAWLGSDTNDEPMIRECVRRLQARRFLHHVGINRFAVQAGDKIEATAQWTAGEATVRATAELIDEGGKVLQRTESAPIPAGTGDATARAVFDLGLAPRVGVKARDLSIRIALNDASDSKITYDRAEQAIKVLPPPRTPSPEEWVTTKDGFFQYRGRPVFLLGINYWPSNHNGKMRGEFNAHWLDPGVFDPDIIRGDLDRLREVGINAVSIQYHDESQAPQLKWFVNECRNRGIWIHCFVGFLQPLEQDLPKSQRLIEAADLKNCPQVFAIDVAWEPHLGGYAERCRFDAEWDAWVKEQYGSIEHAEDVIGFPFLTKDGVITGPSDEQLRTDGKHRVLVAVYRRFVNDLMSRRYGEVARLVRRLGCKQLLSARSGYGGTGNSWGDPLLPIDLGSGAVHFDFVSPEGYALTGDTDQFHEGGFLTAYARGISGGKPVAWMEFGCSVGANPQKPDLENQARLYRNMFDLCARSKAAACFGWWFPGGWRVDERSDMGVVNPDGTWRPVGAAIREYGAHVRGEKLTVGLWNGREVDSAKDARGLSALWKANAAEYRTQMSERRIEEVRPAGFGKLTTELPLVSVGDVAFKAPAPLKYVNAEWGRIESDGRESVRSHGQKVKARVGQQLRIELINTGPATWSAHHENQDRTVLVEVRSGTDRHSMTVEQTSFGERISLSWQPPSTGVWRLRSVLQGAGAFGESLEVEVTR